MQISCCRSPTPTSGAAALVMVRRYGVGAMLEAAARADQMLEGDTRRRDVAPQSERNLSAPPRFLIA